MERAPEPSGQAGAGDVICIIVVGAAQWPTMRWMRPRVGCSRSDVSVGESICIAADSHPARRHRFSGSGDGDHCHWR